MILGSPEGAELGEEVGSSGMTLTMLTQENSSGSRPNASLRARHEESDDEPLNSSSTIETMRLIKLVILTSPLR